jgi:xanthine dehydrogenase YagS FAD-binding subunit
MKAFEYVAPTSVEGAVDRLEERAGESQPLAGGMDIIGLMKDYVLQPERIVALRDVGDLRGIEETADGGLRIGAMVTVADIADDERIRASWPALAAAAGEVGTPQIRNRGTIGGNLCQRPRCWYFRSEAFTCLRKGGAACFAVDGDNRHHAIFDTAPCPIVHPSNCAIALQAYGASVTVAGPGPSADEPVRLENMSIADFFVRPARNIRRENVLGDDQIVTAIELPAPSGNSATYTIKHKQSHDWPLAMATAVLQMDGSTVTSASIVMGAVAPIPWRSSAAEQAITGQTVSVASAEAAAEAAVAEAEPLDYNAYKVRLARTAVKRAILEAAGIDWATG